MSLLGKNWQLLNEETEGNPFDKILTNRGLNSPEEQESELHDPFLFEDMEKAITRIQKALDSKERIIVFGDYDVDGISGTAVLMHIFRKLGAQISGRIPNRVTDGYGLTAKFVPDFVENNVGLVITVDCGISCAEVVTECKEQGVDVIVTDHHSIPENPPNDAVAILHPKLADSAYPYKDLTGSGVAFKLAHALINKFLPDQREQLLDELVDLASLGTVADMGPLQGENRAIVKRGLGRLRSTRWPGLKLMMETAKVDFNDINASTIGFRIGPRINAAGRIGDPYKALKLLLHNEVGPQTIQLSQDLEDLNNERIDLTRQACEEAEQMIVDPATGEIPPLLMASSSDWHVGIVGLVAGRLAEKFSRPAIIMQDFGDKLVASARSPEFFNIVEALRACSEHLSTFGGHAQAAGFTVTKDNFPDFKAAILAYAADQLADQEFKATLKLDCLLPEDHINFDFLAELDRLSPFGIANSRPRFLLPGLKPFAIDRIGREHKHLRLKANLNGQSISAIAFSMGEFAEQIKQAPSIDLACNLERNLWNNREYLQLKVLDIRLN